MDKLKLCANSLNGIMYNRIKSRGGSMKYLFSILMALGILMWIIEFGSVEEELKSQPREVALASLLDRKTIIQKESPLFDANDLKEDLRISLGEDKNTTIEKELEFNALLNNTEANYLYLWKEGDSIVGSGLTLRRSFPLGQHQLDFLVFDGDELVAQDEVNVTAWRYLKKEYLYFDYSEHNYLITYTYDGENLLSMERVNDEGYIIESHIYDEEGKEILQQNYNEVVYGTYPDPYANYEESQEKNVVILDKEGHVIHAETDNGLYIRNYKYENGKIVYREVIHPRGKNSASFQYNESGQEIHRAYISLDKDGNIRSSDTVDTQYNEAGSILRKERLYAIEETPVQHTVDQWSFEKGKIVRHETEALVGVCPCTANIVKERTTYTYDKNGTMIASNYEYQREEDDAYKKSKESKVVISYTNVLE